VARGRRVHAGRRLGLSEVHVTDDAGRLIAHGTSRCVIFPPAADVPAPGPPGDETSPENEAEAGWAPPYTRAVQGSVLAQEVFDQRGGLDVVRGLIDGDLPLPPASYLLGARPIGAEEGSCTFSMPASPWFISPLGSIEGGVIACLADFSLGAAMHTTLPPGTTVAPTDLRAQFIRPVPADGRQVTARAGVVHRGRSLVAARAEVLNEEGKLLALASASGLVLAGRRADLASAAPLG